MHKKYIVTLTTDEQTQLLDLIKKGTLAARKLTRAHILLRAHEGETDEAIAASLHIHRTTVERTRQRFVEGNLEGALSERPRPGGKRKLDDKQEARLIATACSTPPEGQKRWTLQLLADELVALDVVDTISDETVRRTLKKTFSSPGRWTSGSSRL
jgi:transposase